MVLIFIGFSNRKRSQTPDFNMENSARALGISEVKQWSLQHSIRSEIKSGIPSCNQHPFEAMGSVPAQQAEHK